MNMFKRLLLTVLLLILPIAAMAAYNVNSASWQQVGDTYTWIDSTNGNAVKGRIYIDPATLNKTTSLVSGYEITVAVFIYKSTFDDGSSNYRLEAISCTIDNNGMYQNQTQLLDIDGNGTVIGLEPKTFSTISPGTVGSNLKLVVCGN